MKTRGNAQEMWRSGAPQEQSSREKARDQAENEPASEGVERPADELAPAGPHPKDANRDARGRFAAGNDGHLSHGAHSAARWEALAPLLREERIVVLDAKGFSEADADPVFVRIVDALNQSVVMMNGYFEFLMQTGGPISAKGRTRRAVEGWSRAADRVAKFAAMVGLERRTRKAIESPAEWLTRLANERADQQPDEQNDDEQVADENESGT